MDPRYERENLIPRPKFLVAKAAPPSPNVGRTLLLADYNYRPSHFPALEFNGIPWDREGDWQSKGVDFDLWFSQEMPKLAKRAELTIENREQSLEDGQIQCKWTENAVLVQIEPRHTDRYFVLCGQAERVERIFVEGATESGHEAIPIRETHKFVLPTKTVEKVELYVVRLSELENSNASDVSHLRCQWNDR